MRHRLHRLGQLHLRYLEDQLILLNPEHLLDQLLRLILSTQSHQLVPQRLLHLSGQ
jgi:hypothetical protein